MKSKSFGLLSVTFLLIYKLFLISSAVNLFQPTLLTILSNLHPQHHYHTLPYQENKEKSNFKWWHLTTISTFN